MNNFTYSNELYHFGVQGQKWGVRRYQNEDGTLTAEGKEHYGRQLTRETGKLAKYENKSAKYTEKAGKFKEARYRSLKAKSSRYSMEKARVERKATRRLFPMNPERAMRKIAKYDSKAARYALKADRMKYDSERNKDKAAKYNRKGEKLANKMVDEYADIFSSDLDSATVDRAKDYTERYGATLVFADEKDKNR